MNLSDDGDPLPVGCSLDCALLEPPFEVAFSPADLRRMEPVQRALLSPLEHDTIDGWRSAVNRALINAFSADSAMFQLHLPGVSPHYSDELPMEILSGYEEWMPDLDRRMEVFQRSVRLGAGNCFTLWKPHLRWLSTSDYFNGLVTELRAFDTVWAAVAMPELDCPPMLHVYHDHPSRGPRFGAGDVELMRLVRPALEAGVRTLLRATGARASLATSIDAQRAGMLVYDLHGEVLHRNPSVARMAGTAALERALVADGRELAWALAAPRSQGPVGGAYASRAVAKGEEYSMSAVRYCEGVFDLRPVVLVTVQPFEAALPRPEHLRERFGLTPRQVEVALLLAERRTNTEIAEELCISPNTAKRHTEAVMCKLGVSDRRDIQHVCGSSQGERLRMRE